MKYGQILKKLKTRSLQKYFLIGFVLGLTSCSSSNFEKSDHYDGKKFFNPGVKSKKGFLQVLKWQLSGGREDWPDWVDDNMKPTIVTALADQEVSLTSVNHATYLIQLPGLNILTDPIFSKRASPLSWIGPSRHRAPGILFEQLPDIHVVLVSHNHYDHLDLPTIRDLVHKFDPIFVTPLGNKKILEKAGAHKIVELDWWQKTDLPTAQIHLVQVQHWSSRSLFDADESLWGGFIIKSNGLSIYFGGDTGYGNHFNETKKRFGPMNVSLLPIGSYEPRWFMKEHHMNPEDAIKAHFDLESDLSFGIHTGTFNLANDGIERPLRDLKDGLIKYGLTGGDFKTLKNGETHFYKKSSQADLKK